MAVCAAAIAAGPDAAASSGEHLVAAVGLEDEVARRVNQVRRSRGVRTLVESRALAAAARRHTREMAVKGYFQHDSASGTAFWRRIERSYDAKGFGRWRVGENLVWNTARATAADVVGQWLRSPSHRANLLARAWRELGVGAYRVRRAGGAYGGRTVTIVTLDLGVRAR